jgi:23S rRNA (uracil1939-C5)-methyltransferase
LLGATFGDAGAAVLRTSIATEERVVWCRPKAHGAEFPDDVRLVDDRTAGGAAIHERVLDRDFRVSMPSFFQASRDAAQAIAREVVARLGDGVRDIADLYAGVGLLGAVAADSTDARLEAVEQSRSAVDDARLNLADLDARVVQGEVAAWQPDRHFDVVIADPGRPGLSKVGVGAVVRGKPSALVLVSCDAASFARDTALLAAQGFRLGPVTLVDAFPQTPHIEAISAFSCHL